MKKIFRLLALLLALITTLSLIACGEKTPDETPGENGGDPEPQIRNYELSDYTIIYSNQLSNRTADSVTTLAAKLSDGTSVSYVPAIDRITEESEKEILIGATNRPESDEAAALLTNDDSFVIKTVGQKIVIYAKTDAITVVALSYFAKLAKQNNYGFNEINYVSEPVAQINVVENKTTSFKIVHLAGLDTNLSDANAKYDYEVKLGYELQSALKSSLSVDLPVVDDGVDREYEILIGWTSRKESDEFIRNLEYNEYGYAVVGNKIVISGTNHTTTKQAVDLFIESIKGFSKNGSLSFYDGMSITKRSSAWNLDFPSYDDGTFAGTLDAGNKAFAVVYQNTSASAFEDYCKKLESEGYTLWQKRSMEDNLYATYTHETRGLVHTYFTANEKAVRIVTYRKGTYSLPKDTERVDGEVIARTAITQYGLDRAGGSVGMCYIVTLEDGSFIIVDSGTQNDAGTMHHEFYKLLQDLNKRPDGKIHIRAWYLTHEHSDHYAMFRQFVIDYGKDVTIDEFWANTPTKPYTYNSANGNITWDSSHSKYQGYINGKFEWITLHTGMEFYAANMKFEVLYTEEDLFPQVCQSLNNTILILKMTDVRSGQTTLWMGDLLYVGCNTLAANFDDYLDCDILQVAHHGKSEAQAIYSKIRPTVAMWSCLNSQKQSQTAGKTYREANTLLCNNVPVHITSDDTYTIYLPFKTGDEIVKWKK